MITEIFITLGCLLSLLFYILTRNNNYWKSRGVPNDKPFLFFGSFFDMVKGKELISDRIGLIYDKFKDYPYVGILVFNQPTFMVRDPKIVRRILVKDFDKFMNRKLASNESVDPILFNTLFSSTDKVWQTLRRKLSPIFTSLKIKQMFPLMKQCVHDLTNYLEKHNEEEIQMKDLSKKFAVDIISSCAFGINANCLKNDQNNEILEWSKKLINFDSVIRNLSLFSYFFIPKFVDIFRFTFGDKEACDYFINLFNKTLKEREELTIKRNDFTDFLNNLRKSESKNDDFLFDDLKMASQALAFFFAGNDTTALTLSFIFHELALDSKVQSRLREEAKEMVEKHGELSYEAIQEMKYLDMIISEVLRMYPLTSFLNRESKQSYTFEETGFTLEKDVSVIIPVSALHFDPEYFPNPKKFDPERFNEENTKNIVPYTYLPFGGGLRNCIGQRFAILMLKIAVAAVIKDFGVYVSKNTEIPITMVSGSLFLTSKKGVHLKIAKL